MSALSILKLVILILILLFFNKLYELSLPSQNEKEFINSNENEVTTDMFNISKIRLVTAFSGDHFREALYDFIF